MISNDKDPISMGTRNEKPDAQNICKSSVRSHNIDKEIECKQDLDEINIFMKDNFKEYDNMEVICDKRGERLSVFDDEFLPADDKEVSAIFDSDEDKKNEDEKLMHCPHCGYFEIWTGNCESNYEYICNDHDETKIFLEDQIIHKNYNNLNNFESSSNITHNNSNPHLFTCKSENCKRSICIFCNADATRNPQLHQQCQLLSYFKNLIENTIDKGMKSICPTCGTIGIKDDNCTHMACMRCSTSYCYCCGGLENRDLHPKGKTNKVVNQIATHNKDWHLGDNYKLQCPLYLSDYSKIDAKRYEKCKTDAEVLHIFHRTKTLAYLHHIYYQYRLYMPIVMEKYNIEY